MCYTYMLLALTIPIKEFLMKYSFLEVVKIELRPIISNEYAACLLKNMWLRPANSSLCRHANNLDFNFTLEAQTVFKPLPNNKLCSIFTLDQYWKCDRNQCELYHFRNRSCPGFRHILILYNGVLCPLALQYASLKCYLLKTPLSYLCSFKVHLSLWIKIVSGTNPLFLYKAYRSL